LTEQFEYTLQTKLAAHQFLSGVKYEMAPALYSTLSMKAAICYIVQNVSSYSIARLGEASNYLVRVAATSAAGMGRHANARFTTPRLQPVHAVTNGPLHSCRQFYGL